MNPLAPFTEMGSYSDYSQTEVEKELGSIIVNAIKLDADMWRQKAFFYPSTPFFHKPGRFNPDSMDLREPLPEDNATYAPPITLIYAPCLVKAGDSDGENYNISYTLVRSQVSSDVPTSHSKSETFARQQQSSSSAAHLPGQFDPSIRPKRAGSVSKRSIDVPRGSSWAQS